MDIFKAFYPQALIRSISQMCIREKALSKSEMAFVKKKLLQAEERNDIIRLARGEGRATILQEIVENDHVLFDWGLKSQHAFFEDSKYREF